MILALGFSAIFFAEGQSVVSAGAKGDGVTDDTAAFQSALDAAAAKGGIVEVPAGRYLIKTHLNIPADVTLEGTWRAPSKLDAMKGSILLAVEGEGRESGPAFITLNSNSTLKGLTVFYPNQKMDDVKPYPWCVASSACDNPSVVDCTLVNPYQGVDFGTQATGRHYIHGLYGQPLRRGIFVDQCYDIGRIENVHFWPFWGWDNHPDIQKWMTANGEAFIFGRSDWEQVTNTFCFGYRVGYHFVHTKSGETNGSFLGIGSDASNIAVDVENSQPYGLQITNGMFVSILGPRPTEVVIEPTHTGVVQFQNCSFWGPDDQIARVDGTGYVSFQNCTLRQWDHEQKGLPAITQLGGDLSVIGNNFATDAPQLSIEGKSKSAVFLGNHVEGRVRVSDPSGVLGRGDGR